MSGLSKTSWVACYFGLLWRKVSESGGLEKLVLHGFPAFSAICEV